MMQRSKDRDPLASRDRVEEKEFPTLPIATVANGAEDRGARRSRKLALLTSLSEGLPTLPAYVFELNSLLAATPVDLKRVGEIIRTDPSLTAQVLRVCNSAVMGFRERVTKIQHAVVLVGTERLRTLVLTCRLIEYVGQRVASEDVQSFWQHCFLTASLSERLAKETGYFQPEQAYLAGLLHDIGALPLLVIASAESRQRESVARFGWGESLQLEREHFGTDHCELGNWIGTSWNFPPALLEVMVSHHQPREATRDRQLVGVVAAADQFCNRRGVVLGAVPPELHQVSALHDQAILRACLPLLEPGEADELAQKLEADFLCLIQLMEFGAAGLFGGGIPKNPIGECEA